MRGSRLLMMLIIPAILLGTSPLAHAAVYSNSNSTTWCTLTLFVGIVWKTPPDSPNGYDTSVSGSTSGSSTPLTCGSSNFSWATLHVWDDLGDSRTTQFNSCCYWSVDWGFTFNTNVWQHVVLHVEYCAWWGCGHDEIQTDVYAQYP